MKPGGEEKKGGEKETSHPSKLGLFSQDPLFKSIVGGPLAVLSIFPTTPSPTIFPPYSMPVGPGNSTRPGLRTRAPTMTKMTMTPTGQVEVMMAATTEGAAGGARTLLCS